MSERIKWLLPVACLAMLVTFAVATPQAIADPFDDSCTAPASPITPATPTTPIDVASGQTLVIASGTYSGGVNSFPAGATVCVAAGATFAPQYINNPAGALRNRGAMNLPGLGVNAGFGIFNGGAITFLSNFNTNGHATITNAPGATMTFTQGFPLNNNSELVNNGTMGFASDLNSDNGTVVTNTGSIAVGGFLRPSGQIHNTGQISVAFDLQTNSSALIVNACTIAVAGGVMNNADIRNAGVIISSPSSSFVNQGRLEGDVSGQITGGNFTNNRQVFGSGRYYFTGTTVNQGPFIGNASTPINFFDASPTGIIFDAANTAPANVIRVAFTPPNASTISPGCATAGADVEVTKTGPAEIAAGAPIAYQVTVVNHGPQSATGVVVTDALPPGVTGASSPGGTVNAGAVTWNVGTLTNGQSVTFTVTGTVSAGAGPVLTNVVSGTSTTADPNAANNDGSAPTARVITQVSPVAPPNTPPLGISQVVTTRATVSVTQFLQAIDPDVGQSLTWTVQSDASRGALDLNPSGHYTYAPDPGFTGVDTFVARVCDNGSPIACGTATVTINVKPFARPDLATTQVDTPIQIGIASNDIGPATAPVIVVPPTSGTAIVNPDQTSTYTPAPGFVGVDTYSYVVCAPTALSAPELCDIAFVTVTVHPPPNRAPAVSDASLATVTDVDATGDVVASDPDVGQTVTFQPAPVSGPTNGTVTIDGSGNVMYTPNANFAGVDEFTVRGCDNGSPSLCDDGVVTVTVKPIAATDIAPTPFNTPVNVAVLANDKGTVGAPTIVTPSPLGTAVVQPDNSITFTPGSGVTGTARITYQICSVSLPAVCDTTNLVVEIDPNPNNPPEIDNETASIPVNSTLTLQLSAIDPEGQPVVFQPTVIVPAPPLHGTVTVTATGLLTYTPTAGSTGHEIVVVGACDNTTPTPLCGQGTVDITVTPIAIDDTTETAPGVPIVVTVLDNDVGDGITVSVVGPPLPNRGTAVANADGSVTFTPEPEQTGIVQVTYQVCSPTAVAVCDIGVITVYIAPIATSLVVYGHPNQPLEILAGVNDIGEAQLIVATSDPAHGLLVDLGEGRFLYHPAPGFTGIDSFTYARCEGFSRLCGEAAVTVIVLPDVLDDQATTVQDQPVEIFVLANDFGTTGRLQIASPPAHGTAVIAGTSIVYTPGPGFIGVDVFTYEACAPARNDTCDVATVTVTVTPLDPGPTPTTTTTTTPPPPTSENVTTTTLSGSLPVTGGNPTPTLSLALALLGIGLTLLGLGRLARRQGDQR